MRVVVVVRGGVVQSTFSSVEDLEVLLLDFDNENFDTDQSAQREFERKTLGMKELPLG
jgi:hypothetical protein